MRTARRHGKSWAEIATKLGVTRQSAWERWRDLDETPSATAGLVDPFVGDTVRTKRVIAKAASAVTSQARAARRRGSVKVPNVVGLAWGEALRRLADAGLVGVAPGSAVLVQASSTVTDQSPESGARVPAGSQVTLWVERGGGSGVREPRRPRPSPRSGRTMLPDPSVDATG